jgi:hypothetical protein
VVQRIPPVIRFLAAQVFAFAVVLATARVQAIAGVVSGYGWVALDAALAILLALAVRLPWWWLPLAAALPVAVAASSGSSIPWWGWGGGFAVLAIIYGGGVATRVPLYLSNRAAADELAKLLPATPGVRACDLGAGLGGPTLAIARRRPDALVDGVEASPLPWLICRLRALGRRNARMRFGNLFVHDLATYDLVYVFLSPEPMPRLWDKARAEMRPGSLLVSNTFVVPGVEPERTIVLPGRSDARLLVYRLP